MLNQAQALVANALRHGWAHCPQQHMSEVEIDRFLRNQAMQRQREKYAARGLANNGKPKLNTQTAHPELQGLPRKEYRAAYMRLRRAGQITFGGTREMTVNKLVQPPPAPRSGRVLAAGQ